MYYPLYPGNELSGKRTFIIGTPGAAPRENVAYNGIENKRRRNSAALKNLLGGAFVLAARLVLRGTLKQTGSQHESASKQIL